MADIDEKRVYGEKTGETELYVTSDMGVTVVSVSADLVGEFALARRCPARDLAAGPDRLAVATDEDVLVSEAGGYAGTGFGPSVAVGFDGDSLLAAGPDGVVGRYGDDGWERLGEAGEVRAVEGDLVAAADGVYRVGDGLSPVGLSDVRDVTTRGTPLAATGDGLFYLGPGWATALEGAFEVVTRAGERAHAATADTLYEQGESEGEWTERDLPVEGQVADVAHGEGVYAVTDDGTVLVDVGDGWRDRALGLRGVTAVAVAP